MNFKDWQEERLTKEECDCMHCYTATIRGHETPHLCKLHNLEKVTKYVSIIMLKHEINPENYENPFMYLSQRINPNKSMYKQYQCPGGHIDEIICKECITKQCEHMRMEKPMETLTREMREETRLYPISDYENITEKLDITGINSFDGKYTVKIYSLI